MRFTELMRDCLAQCAIATDIVRAELRAILRNPRIFLSVGIATGLMGVLCVSSYPDGGRNASLIGSQIAQSMIGIQLFVLWLAALVAIPALGILGTHQEVRAGNLDHIAATQLRECTLTICKGLALLLLYLLVAAAVLPVSGMAFFLAGVEVGPYLLQLSALLLFTVIMVVVSLRLAKLVPTTWHALLYAILFGLVFGGGVAILVSDYDFRPIPLVVAAASAIALIGSQRFPFLHRLNRTRKIAPRPHAPRLQFPDSANPIRVSNRIFFDGDRNVAKGCALVPVGFAICLVSVVVDLFSVDSTMPALFHAFRSLLWAVGAVLAVTLLHRGSDALSLDALRCSLLSKREYLKGKLDAVWQGFIPLLLGWYIADLLCWLELSYEPPLRDFYHFVLVGMNIPEFHIILLLVAVGVTFGESSTTRILSGLLWSVPGLLLPSLVGDYLEYRIVQPNSPEEYLDQFGIFTATYALFVAVSVMGSLVLVRWRYKRVWSG